MPYQDKFIAFLDILGFKHHVAESEAGIGLTTKEIEDALTCLGNGNERGQYQQTGPTICPSAPRVRQDLDFRVHQVSDCAILSCEVSPAGFINLIQHSSRSVLRLLQKGFLCRGYITRGQIHHTEKFFFGSGYLKSYEGEKKVHFRDEGSPFVELDLTVTEFFDTIEDACVRTTYTRLVEKHAEWTAVFPFKQLADSIVISGELKNGKNIEAYLESNYNLQKGLLNLKNLVEHRANRADKRSAAKADHYLNALETQLGLCAQNNRFLNSLKQ